MSKLTRVAFGVIKKGDNWQSKKNRFTTDDLIISYEFVDKDEGVVNYEKLNYDFE